MLNDYEKFKVVRPIIGDHEIDKFNMPIMHRVTEDMLDLEKATGLNLKNLSCKYDNTKKIVFPFNQDSDLLKFWSDPLKYIPRIQTAMAVGTPDYSVLDNMNPNEIQHNVYMNRWLGCLWQDYGGIGIPTIPWAGRQTYDICFSGIEPNGVVMISTLSTSKHLNEFLDGFRAMKEALSPSLIIVYGKMLEGMTGRFINFEYEECFNDNQAKYHQEELFHVSPIFEIKEVM